MDDFHSSTTGMELWERSHGAFFKALVSSASLPVSAWSEQYIVTKCQKSQDIAMLVQNRDLLLKSYFGEKHIHLFWRLVKTYHPDHMPFSKEAD